MIDHKTQKLLDDISRARTENLNRLWDEAQELDPIEVYRVLKYIRRLRSGEEDETRARQAAIEGNEVQDS